MNVTPRDIKEDNTLIAMYLQRWRRYSLSFYIEALRSDKFWYPTKQQADLCHLSDYHKNVAIRAGRGVGKTNFLAFRVLHHLVCFRIPGLPVKVPITGPTGGQLSDVIWAEIAAMLEHLLPWLRDRFTMNNDGLYCDELPKNWFASPRTARKENTKSIQGLHGSTLNIYDEASGIPAQIMRVSTSGMTEAHARALVAGNPDELSGYFYDIFHKFKTRWTQYGIDCFDCKSDVVYEYPYIDPTGEQHIIKKAGRCTPQWFKDQEDELGLDTPFWDAYVRGKFPKQATQTLIKENWVSQAWETMRANDTTRPRILGVDPGGNITPAGIVQRRGADIEHAERLYGMEPQPLATYVMDYFDAQTKAGKKIDYIAVDSIGIGAGVHSILISKQYPSISVKASEAAPKHGIQCLKMRDWLWWQARSFFRDYAVCFCHDDDEMRELAKEITLPQQKPYKNGKLSIESKEDLEKRGFKSPNLADALNLTFKLDYQFAPPEPKPEEVDVYKTGRGSYEESTIEDNWKCQV